MKKYILSIICVLSLIACNNTKSESSSSKVSVKIEKPKPVVVHLTESQYREKVFNYRENPNKWIFEGEKPCIVDFYADWCRPCKMISPYFDSLAVEYAGKVDFYKVNVDEARELSEFFRVQSIPMVCFCSEDVLQYSNGAYPIDFYRKMIDSLMLR